jgi:hypothetical protein
MKTHTHIYRASKNQPSRVMSVTKMKDEVGLGVKPIYTLTGVRQMMLYIVARVNGYGIVKLK